MPQSSLMTWLSMPASVKKSPVSRAAGEVHVPTPPASGVDIQAEKDNELPKRETTSESLSRTSLKALPANVELRACTKDDIPHLKRLTSLLLPIPYPEKFYREIIEDPLTRELTLVAVWHDDIAKKGESKGLLIGAIRCRLLNAFQHSSATTPDSAGPMLYLSTLVLLSPYRQHGIASHMLQVLIRRAVEGHGISSVGAHVWEANDLGLEWYRKRAFREVGREPEYYRRLNPAGALVMQRDVHVSDLMPG